MGKSNILFLVFCYIYCVYAGCVRTLYNTDPEQIGLAFANGTYSTVYTNYWPYNNGDNMDWNEYNKGQFTLAAQGNDQGAFVDLGTADDLIGAYGISNPVLPDSSIYGTIHFENQQLVLAQVYYQSFQPFSSATLSQLAAVGKMATFAPVVGHIYLINITSSSNIVVKMMVTNMDANSVTVHWDVIFDSSFGGIYDQCFAFAKQTPTPTPSPNTVSSGTESTSVPTWVLACVIVLFVLFAIILALLFVVVIRSSHSDSHSHHHETERIGLVNGVQYTQQYHHK